MRATITITKGARGLQGPPGTNGQVLYKEIILKVDWNGSTVTPTVLHNSSSYTLLTAAFVTEFVGTPIASVKSVLTLNFNEDITHQVAIFSNYADPLVDAVLPAASKSISSIKLYKGTRHTNGSIFINIKLF